MCKNYVPLQTYYIVYCNTYNTVNMNNIKLKDEN